MTNAFGRWIDKSGLSRDQVARKLGLTRKYVDTLCRDGRRPDLELAITIEDMTKGAVPVRTWLAVPKHGGD